jgi:hypothetical protein
MAVLAVRALAGVARFAAVGETPYCGQRIGRQAGQPLEVGGWSTDR